MKKGEIYTGIVTKLLFPNKGIAECEPYEIDGKITESEKCVVKNVIPGQIIRFRVTKKRHGECEGILIDVVKKADSEIIPNCSHFGKCGGCAYQSLSYENQLKIKEEQVFELLCPTVKYDLRDQKIYAGIKESPKRFGYKNKMEFSFGDEFKGGELNLGLHKKGSFYDIVDVSGCQIVCEDIRKIVDAVLVTARNQKLTFFHKVQHTGLLRHLVVRRSESTGDILVMLVTTSYEKFDIDVFTKSLKNLKLDGQISGFLHCINDSPADTVKADELKTVFGQDFFYESVLGLKFKVTPFSFFQTNTFGAEVLYKTARDFVTDAIGEVNGEKPVIFDLYSGTGTITQLLSPVAKHVYGVEIVDEAVKSAVENVKLNGLTNCSFLTGDVLKVLDEIEEKPDFIVLDPPRDGVHPTALKKIINYNVKNMIYISCKPTSLARDLPVLHAAGYEVKRLAMVDMFPWTANVETCVLLTKSNDSADRV